MTHQVMLTIPDTLFQKAQRLAKHQARQIEEVLADAIALEDDSFVDLSEPNAALDREMDAYIAMHPLLKRKMLGRHVAIFDSELVDHDADFGTLVQRIRDNYANKTVWLTTVKSEPIDTIIHRSPRLLPQ